MSDTGLTARRAAALRALTQRPDTSRFPGETQPSGALPDNPDQAARYLNARYTTTEEPTR
ncbi:hypothetical protein OG244_28300 [Streptomyces brevispora]|uniref:hypothetical protein n=1 Tax=Streptomyces brevispora TaxID=887462 RepID=UPI002E3477E3|nr:hypothetical protein [Streptomyces brevispora]